MLARRLQLGIVLTILAVPLAAAEESMPREFVRQDDVVYRRADGDALHLDLVRPRDAAEPMPGLVFIHGGGWQVGSKDAFSEALPAAAARGYVAVSIQYRLAPEHRFPSQIDDCRAAVRWLRAHAVELQLEPERIGALGTSAGGHLALMLGVVDEDDDFDDRGPWPGHASKVQAAVSFAGPTNLMAEFPPRVRRIIEIFLGGPRDELAWAYRRASPLNYVDARDAPTLLLQGTGDELIPTDQAWQMAAALTDAGVPGRVELLLGAPHDLDGEASGAFFRALDFFDEWLKEPAK